MKQNEAIGRTVSDLLNWAEANRFGPTTQPITISGTAPDAVSIRWDGMAADGPDDYHVVVYVVGGELMAGGLQRRWNEDAREMGEWTTFDTGSLR